MKGGWVDRVSITLGVLLLGLVVIEVFVPHSQPRFPWHHVPGYAAIIGLVGCIVVVQLSKWLGSRVLHRPEEPDE